MVDSMNEQIVIRPRRRDVGSSSRWMAGPVRPGWLVGGLLLALALVTGLVSGNALSWLGGALAGAGVGAYLVLRAARGRETARPAPLVQRLTSEALEALGAEGWHSRHDVVTADGVYDHVAVGPGGVVLLQSVAAGGPVVMHAGEPVVDGTDELGRRRLHRLRPQAHADAVALREAIARATGRRVWVQSVVVFWSPFEPGCVVDGRCVYIHGSRLADWMRRRPHQLLDAQIAGVLEDVASLAAARDELLALAV